LAVGGRDKPGYWQADALGRNSRRQIFQNFRWDTETISGTDATGNWVGGDVIKHLREKPADIDGVREVKNARCLSSTSEKACFTRRWQSSNVPATSSAVMFSPSVVNCFSWASLMRFEG